MAKFSATLSTQLVKASNSGPQILLRNLEKGMTIYFSRLKIWSVQKILSSLILRNFLIQSEVANKSIPNGNLAKWNKSEVCRKMADLPKSDKPYAEHLIDFDVPDLLIWEFRKKIINNNNKNSQYVNGCTANKRHHNLV